MGGFGARGIQVTYFEQAHPKRGSLDILANVAVKIPGIPRISSNTLSGNPLSTFSTMIALLPGLVRPTGIPAIVIVHFQKD